MMVLKMNVKEPKALDSEEKKNDTRSEERKQSDWPARTRAFSTKHHRKWVIIIRDFERSVLPRLGGAKIPDGDIKLLRLGARP